MKTYLDCIPCFFRQGLEAGRIAGAGKNIQKDILHEFAIALPRLSLDSSPPEIGGVIYGIVKKFSRKRDPYNLIKKRSNLRALSLYPALKRNIQNSKDRMLRAVRLAIAGNIIDYGVKNSLDVEEGLKEILKETMHKKYRGRPMRRGVFVYRQFRDRLRKSDMIMYLADNAGEVVFDRILIEEIKRLYPDKRIIYAVKEGPIINDALAGDAYMCGIDKLAEVVSCGLSLPGTVLSLCSHEFLRLYKKADMVISKGQGNFEAFNEHRKPAFFLFMAKCQPVASNIGCRVGDMNLYFNHGIRNGNKGRF